MVVKKSKLKRNYPLGNCDQMQNRQPYHWLPASRERGKKEERYSDGLGTILYVTIRGIDKLKQNCLLGICVIFIAVFPFLEFTLRPVVDILQYGQRFLIIREKQTQQSQRNRCCRYFLR